MPMQGGGDAARSIVVFFLIDRFRGAPTKKQDARKTSLRR